MASSTSCPEETLIEDASLCSVCFEKFKSPRTLPCRHSFCHVCLSASIDSSCKDKEVPVGFRCPLCREFIPGVGEQKKWVDQFPMNESLLHILEISKIKLCGACEVDNEEIPGVNYCFECQEAMCEGCTNSHRKIASSRNHTVRSLNEAMDTKLQANIYNTCRIHQDRPVELVCNDHEELCCALCAGTRHRKCNSVDTLEVTAGKIRDECLIQNLVESIKHYEQKLVKVKSSMEENIDKLDDEAEKFTKEVEKREEDLITHITKAKRAALEELARVTKTSKEKISRSTESVEDQIECIKKCQKTLADISDTSDMVKQIAELFRIKQISQNLQSSSIKEICITSKVKHDCDVSKTKKQLVFPTFNQAECARDINRKVNIKTATLKADVSFSVEGKEIYFGIFLMDGSILFPQHENPAKCLLFNQNAKQIRTITAKYMSLSVCLSGKEIYISCPTANAITVISSETFAILRSMTVKKTCYGLDIKNNKLYVACSDSIDLMDKNCHTIRSYVVENNVHCVTVSRHGNMVYSNHKQDFISSMDMKGKTLWTYKCPTLKFPYGMGQDSRDNIYIASVSSNNIHVLSCEGVLLRLFSGIKQPWFITFPPYDDSTCCICCNKGDMTIYRIC